MENLITYTLIFIFILAILSLSTKIFFKAENYSSVDLEKKEIKIKDNKYFLEVADNDITRMKGLMNRASMPLNEGMLFVFDYVGIHSFWMKNTLIPLDMIWLNSDGEVVYIHKNAKPCSNLVQAICQSIIPTKTSKYVIELNAGEIDKSNIKVGDIIKL